MPTFNEMCSTECKLLCRIALGIFQRENRRSKLWTQESGALLLHAKSVCSGGADNQFNAATNESNPLLYNEHIPTKLDAEIEWAHHQS